MEISLVPQMYEETQKSRVTRVERTPMKGEILIPGS
jgi:hypothetical protein